MKDDNFSKDILSFWIVYNGNTKFKVYFILVRLLFILFKCDIRGIFSFKIMLIQKEKKRLLYIMWLIYICLKKMF